MSLLPTVTDALQREIAAVAGPGLRSLYGAAHSIKYDKRRKGEDKIRQQDRTLPGAREETPGANFLCFILPTASRRGQQLRREQMQMKSHRGERDYSVN